MKTSSNSWLRNPYILLFLTVGLAVWVGKFTVKGYGLGMVAAAIVVGAGTLELGVDLRRQDGARQLRQVALLLPVHVRRRPARRPVVHQQPEEATASSSRSSRWSARSSGCSAPWCFCQAVRICPPARPAASSPARMTMSAAIGSAEEAVDARACSSLPRAQTSEDGQRHDRALLRPDLHLGHGRHHPDLQVPAALVGHRCQGGREGVRGGARRAERRRRRPHRLPPAGAARLPARQRRGRGQDHRAVPPDQSRSTGSSTWCAATSAGRPGRPRACSWAT